MELIRQGHKNPQTSDKYFFFVIIERKLQSPKERIPVSSLEFAGRGKLKISKMLDEGL